MSRPGDLSSVSSGRRSRRRGGDSLGKRGCAVSVTHRPECRKQRKIEEFFDKGSSPSSRATSSSFNERKSSLSDSTSTNSTEVETSCDGASTCGSESVVTVDSEIEQKLLEQMESISAEFSDCCKDLCFCECHIHSGLVPDFAKMDITEVCMDCSCCEEW